MFSLLILCENKKDKLNFYTVRKAEIWPCSWVFRRHSRIHSYCLKFFLFSISSVSSKCCKDREVCEEGLPNIWGNAQIFRQWGGHYSHMTLQLLHSEFSYLWGKLYFLFYQCSFMERRMYTEIHVFFWLGTGSTPPPPPPLDNICRRNLYLLQ